MLADLAFGVLFIANAQLGNTFVLAAIMALTWLNVGPYFIWYYDQKLLPEFFARADEIIGDNERLHALARKYDNFFSHRYWIITIPWTALVLYAISGLKLVLSGGVFYWMILAGGVWIALLSSIGFWGVVTTMLAIREISREKLTVDPFHPDKLGGLSCIGTYAIGTTLLFSTGSLFLPIIFDFISAGEPTVVLSALYAAVFVFSGFTLFSFLYPTVKINRAAESARRAILENLRQQYAVLQRSVARRNTRTANLSEAYPRLNHLRDEYMDYRRMKLYPFEVEILVKLIISVILPFILLLVNRYLLP